MGPKGKRDMVSEKVWMFEEEQCCYSGQTMCLDKMEWYRTNKIIVEILNCNGTTGNIIPSSFYLWSLTKCYQPRNTGIYRFGPVLVVWSGYLAPGTICKSTIASDVHLQYNNVLTVVIELLRAQCETANQQRKRVGYAMWHIQLIEVGCRGFIGHLDISFLSKNKNH